MNQEGLKAHRTLLSVVMLALVIGGIAYGIYQLRNPGPLTGEIRHDFGVIPIDGLKGSAEYTFELLNETSETIYIESVKPSCGCTAVEISTQYVEPNQTVGITARLTVNNSGLKESRLRVVMPEHNAQTLYVKGYGRRNTPLSSIQSRVSIEPRGKASIRLSAEVYESIDPPAEPEITLPEGFNIEMGQWSKRGSRDSLKRMPDRYAMTVTVVHTGETLPENGTMILSMPDENGELVTLELPIRQRTAEEERGRVIEPPQASRDG